MKKYSFIGAGNMAYAIIGGMKSGDKLRVVKNAKMPAMLEVLLAHGGDPTRRDKRGLNAIDLAAAQNDCIAMQMLLSAIDAETARETVTALAPNLPLSDDNQAMLGILKKYL